MCFMETNRLLDNIPKYSYMFSVCVLQNEYVSITKSFKYD